MASHRWSVRRYLFLAAAVSLTVGLGVVAVTVQRVAARQLNNYAHNRDLAVAHRIALNLDASFVHGGWPAVARAARQAAQTLDSPIVIRGPGGRVRIAVAVAAAPSPTPVAPVQVPLQGAGGRRIGRLEIVRPPAFAPRLSPVLQAIEAALAGGSAAAFIAAMALAAILGERVARPLQRIAAGVRRLGSGHLSERVPVTGPQEIAALAGDFNAVAQALEQSEQRQRRLIADLAHELRTPISILLGYLEAARDGVAVSEPDPLRAALVHTRNLAQLVNDLQELALAEAKELPLAMAAVSLPEVVTDLLAELEWEAQRKAIRLIRQPSEDAEFPPVWADPRRLGQVVRNLLTNALKFTPAGGTVTVTLSREANGLRLTVADSGPGIAADDLPHVFDRLYRGDRARERGGVGLGLAIAKSLMDLQGGHIGVETEAGHGCRFWITLAWAPEAPRS